MNESDKTFNELKSISTLLNYDVEFRKIEPHRYLIAFLSAHDVDSGIMIWPYRDAVKRLIGDNCAIFVNNGNIELPFILPSHMPMYNRIDYINICKNVTQISHYSKHFKGQHIL